MPKLRLEQRTDTEVKLEAWQRQLHEEQALDAAGFVDDDDVVAILGDMEDELRPTDEARILAEGVRRRPIAIAEAAAPGTFPVLPWDNSDDLGGEG